MIPAINYIPWWQSFFQMYGYHFRIVNVLVYNGRFLCIHDDHLALTWKYPSFTNGIHAITVLGGQCMLVRRFIRMIRVSICLNLSGLKMLCAWNCAITKQSFYHLNQSCRAPTETREDDVEFPKRLIIYSMKVDCHHTLEIDYWALASASARVFASSARCKHDKHNQKFVYNLQHVHRWRCAT